MGLREKVALVLAFITITQVIFVYCSTKDKTPNKSFCSKKKQTRNVDVTTSPPRVINLRPQILSSKPRNKEDSDRNYEALRKTFNFPEIEYPTASTPRPPFYLQETNILQRNPVQREANYPSSATQQTSVAVNRKDRNKRIYDSKLTNYKTVKNPGIENNIPDSSTTPRPYYPVEGGVVPDVEYSLSTKDIRKSNYWNTYQSRGSTNQVNKRKPDIVSKDSSSINTKDYKNKQQTQPLIKSNNIQDAENTKTAIEEPDNKNIIQMDVHTSTSTTQSTEPLKTDQHKTTPAPTQSIGMKTTKPFVLTPYTTIYFDTTPSFIDTITTPKDESNSTTRVPKKKKAKKKSANKENVLVRSKTGTIKDDESSSTSTPFPDMYKKQVVDSHVSKNSSLVKSTASLPDYICSHESISSTNLSTSDSRPYTFNNTQLSSSIVTKPTSGLRGDIDPSPILVSIHEYNKTSIISEDKKVTSISDATNTIVSNNRYNKDSSCFEDNIMTLMNSNKSSARDDKTNDSLLSRREDVIIPPSDDEEFTTDVFPDFDENNLSPFFTVSTSTLSPMTVTTVDEAWVNSHVIDPYKSLSYPDELEQYYILVP